MNKFSANTTLATLAVAAGFVAFTSFSAQASVTSKLQNCRYDSREKVISCCEKVVRLGVTPYWMVQAGGSCGSVTFCKGGRKPGSTAITHVAVTRPKCYIAMTPDGSRDGGIGGKNPPVRGKNNTQGNNGNTKPF